MYGKLRICITAFLFLVFQNSPAREPANRSSAWKGYIKDLQTVSFVDDADSLVTSNLIHNRINFKYTFSSHWNTRIEMRNRIFYGEQVKMTPGFAESVSVDNGYFDLTRLWVDEAALVAVSTFDRVLLNYTSEKISVTAGRQRINWGINTVWNPNDLFNAYNFLDFDYEERPGSDAVRIQYFPQRISSVEIAFKPSKEEDQTVAAALLKVNKWKYDFQFLGGVYYKDIVVGAGWAGNIWDAGWKGEVSFFQSKSQFTRARNDFTGSVTLDYSLKKAWYVSASVLYVQHPATALTGPANLSMENLSPKALMPFHWSVYAGAMKSFTPIVTGNLAVIYSPQDNSTIIFPTLTYSAAENFDLDLTAQSFFSDQSGEYKTMGNSVYLRFRWSF